MLQEDSFFLKVYSVVKLIPEGKITTYGAIARYLGSPKSSRMVTLWSSYLKMKE